MGRYLLLVYSKAAAGQEAAYHDWYDRTHLAEVIAVPGFKAASRYAPAASAETGPGATGEYLAIYEIEAEDPAATMAALTASAAKMNMSTALDLQNIRMELHQLITPRLERA